MQTKIITEYKLVVADPPKLEEEINKGGNLSAARPFSRRDQTYILRLIWFFRRW